MSKTKAIIRVGYLPIQQKIVVGKIRNGRWVGERYDVTLDAIAAVYEYLSKIGNPTDLDFAFCKKCLSNMNTYMEHINSVRLVNLTPHRVTVINDGNEVMTIEASGVVARCKTDTVIVGSINGVPITRTVFGDVEGLPEASTGVFYIVSAIVKNARPDRSDLLVPVGVVKDDEGRIVGCTSLGI